MRASNVSEQPLIGTVGSGAGLSIPALNAITNNDTIAITIKQRLFIIQCLFIQTKCAGSGTPGGFFIINVQ